MDPVTHGLTGVMLSNLFPRKKGTLLVALFASLAPDLDYVTRFWGTEVFLRYHRGITHGIGALLLVPLLVGIAARRAYRGRLLFFVMLSYLCYGVHIAMDLMTQYPTRVLSPLDWSAYSLGIAFIIDPYVSAAIVLAILFSMRKSVNRRLASLICILFLIVYLFGRFYIKGKVEDYLRTELDEYHYSLYPLPNDFFRWWFVTRSGDLYKVGFVDLLTETVCVKRVLNYTERIPEIKESKQLRTVRNFLYFAQKPYAEVKRQDGETIVTWHELSYGFFPGDHFIARVRFDRMGRVREEYFRF
ncbi:MAG TPA: metal-dependent hydrolase [Nitrospirae bacterium]|nr:metal-dependent hydrolase [Nitrospirota bacterium]